MRSNASHEELFPTFYRRTNAGEGSLSHTQSSTTATSVGKAARPSNSLDRVVYAPMAEQKKLGYFSTACLIISKVIGTGVFAKPSVVLQNSGGKAVSLGLWFACGLMSLAGLIIYVELGIAMPFSGGEVIYVDEAYPRPKYLAVIVVSLLFIFLTHWAGNCITFGKLILQAFDPGNPNPNYHLQKFIALVMLTCVCAVHMFSRKMGIALNNFLAIYKVSLVAFIIIIGFAAMGGAKGKGVQDGGNPRFGLKNISTAELMRTEGKSMSEYATAILGVLWAYTGWENANYVLSEVKRPPGHESRVFKVAAFASIGTLTMLYMLANIAYFAVLTNEEMLEDGDIVAAKFFVKVFGKGYFSERILKVMVALSIMGNFISSTYSVARVKQEIAKLRILPFSQFWARQSHYDTPSGALLLHWLVAALFIIFTPNNHNDEVYNLITDLFIYGQSWMLILVSMTVFALRAQPLRAWTPALFRYPVLVTIVAIYVPLNVFVLVLSWWPPPKALEKKKNIPSYVTPGVATGIIAFGLIYWVVFAKVLPALGYEVSSCPDELVDGSRVVTYKRHKTGFAKMADEWWLQTVLRRGRESR
ncbi:amino acid permease-domain-containing protein [Sphaerosporella brunnea]|uniref:Amino acid permease-domain-containing protein n=1 Tax=Sphaerosporella brunnea TaxID=1250544 RepID=A0A5J5EUU8_9PEZI|nr:amino acid permease-domain-containing protein [Sphaerosporella brunnea]